MDFKKIPEEAKDFERAKELIADENTPVEQKNELVKLMVLAAKETQPEIYSKYFVDIVEPIERKIMEDLLKNRTKEDRGKFIEVRLKDLIFEKEILEAKIKVVKQFMD